MKKKIWMSIVPLVAACSRITGDAPAGAGSAGAAASAPASAASAPAPPPAGTAPAPLVTTLPGLDAAALCSDSALLLVDVPLEQAGKRFCEVCLPVISNACSGTWPDDFVAAGAPAAERVHHLRNAIYAAHGYPFRKEKWKALYGRKPWYRPNARFEVADLSETATHNLAALTRAHGASSPGIELEIAAGGSGFVDLDGDGKPEPIGVEPDGSGVRAGPVTVAATERPPASASEPTVRGAAIIDVDRRKPGKQLALRYEWDEDEAGWAVFDIVGERAVYVGEVPPGDVPGDGTVIATSWHCGVTTRTTFAVGARGFVERARKDSGKLDPSKCAACPYVYLVTPGGPRFQGEVLRHQAGAGGYRTDVLTLEDPPLIDGGFIRLELREVEPETTYLDSIQLEVDGELVDPLECGAVPSACAADQRFVVIDQGAGRTFTFPWRGPAPRHLAVRATGYYLPHPQ